jgi:penicillin-binding protein 2
MKLINRTRRRKIREIPLSQYTLDTVKKGMRSGVMSGTSGQLGYLKVPVAGKTGTAQTRSIRLEKFSQHAWWVGFAPFDGQPEQSVVIAVFIEYGVAGASSAVPVAEAMLKKMIELGYFTPSAAPAIKTETPVIKTVKSR